jgi:hypothetical protein
MKWLVVFLGFYIGTALADEPGIARLKMQSGAVEPKHPCETNRSLCHRADPCEVDPDAKGCPCPPGMVGQKWPNCLAPPQISDCVEKPNLPECQSPEAPPVPDCKVPNCETPERNYIPAFMPSLYNYSKPELCEADYPNPSPRELTVRLRQGETLHDALARLYAKSPEGGVLEVEGDTVQCDSIRWNTAKFGNGRITVRGINGMARAYCRAASFANFGKNGNVKKITRVGGTIPKEQVTGMFLVLGDGTPESFVMENFEVDGYNYGLRLGPSGKRKLLNVYAHSGYGGNGISNVNTGNKSDIWTSLARRSRFELNLCGVEVSHYGQGNHSHNFYMHRSLGGGGESEALMAIDGAFDSWTAVNIVDSFIHSARWSSNFKSIANENNIYNTRIGSTALTFGVDDGLPEDHSQAEVDIALAAQSMIKDSDFRKFKPDLTGKGGSAVVAYRARMTAMRGNDVPMIWYPYHIRQADPKTGKKTLVTPENHYPDHPIHTQAWWKAQNGAKQFINRMEDTDITITGPYAHKLSAVTIYHTRWLWDDGNSPCLLPMPENAYERAHVYMKDVSMEGFRQGKEIEVRGFQHSKRCRESRPKKPTLQGWRRFGVYTIEPD